MSFLDKLLINYLDFIPPQRPREEYRGDVTELARAPERRHACHPYLLRTSSGFVLQTYQLLFIRGTLAQ